MLTTRIDHQVLLALAIRCETEEPSRLLDSQIAVALRIRPAGKLKNAWIDKFPTWRPRGEGRVEVVNAGDKGGGGVHWEVAPFTSSVDAAVTLVPQSCAWTAGRDITFVASAIVYGQDIHADTNGETPALALCAAALRARADGKQEEAFL